MDDERAFVAAARGQQPETPAPPLVGEGLLRVAGAQALALGQYPDLQEVDPLRLRGVHLAVADARPGRHHLHLARPDHPAPTGRVPVRETARERDGDDLHVAVRVRAYACFWLYEFLIYASQIPVALVPRVVVVAER